MAENNPVLVIGVRGGGNGHREYGYKDDQLPESHKAIKQTAALPLYPQMSENDLAIVSETLRKVLSNQVR